MTRKAWKEKMIAMIPARMGSNRLAMKNLALLDSMPLIYYAIKAAKDSGVFDEIIVNSEDDVFGEIASRYGVKFYKRPSEHATSEAKSDFVVYDFVRNNPCDVVAWINTTSPLQTGEEVRRTAEYFLDKGLDSLITTKDEQVHCFYKGRPLNFRKDGVFAKTQDLEPVSLFIYSIMMWRSDVFIKEFEKKGHALFCGKFGSYPASKLAGIIIKRAEDLMLADYVLRSAKDAAYTLKYDPLTKRKGAKAKR